MAAGNHFGCPKIQFLVISDKYHNFYFCEFCLQNGCRRPFWMSENHFWSNFWPYQINAQLVFFYKMTAVGHFGCPKFTLDHISGHFRSIQIFIFFLQNGCRWPFWMSENHFRSHFYPFHIDTQLNFFWKFLTKWLTSAILDVRISISIAFLAISDRYATLYFFWKFLTKWLPSAILPKFTLDHISGHF